MKEFPKTESMLYICTADQGIGQCKTNGPILITDHKTIMDADVVAYMRKKVYVSGQASIDLQIPTQHY